MSYALKRRVYMIHDLDTRLAARKERRVNRYSPAGKKGWATRLIREAQG